MACRRVRYPPASIRLSHPSMQESCQSANGLGGIPVIEAARILAEAGDHAAS
jgi:hypothetical protein